MQAVVFRDVGVLEVVDVPVPELIETTDALIRVHKTAICGSDLHILHGRIPGMIDGGIMGHEFTGTIEAVGTDVHLMKVGDTVVASFIIPCGACWYCEKKLFNRCEDCQVFGYGTFFGAVDGAQAEYVRVPKADLTLHHIGKDELETALFLGDIFTTAFDAVDEGHIVEGDDVVVQGCGPVGLLAIQVALSRKPNRVFAIDSIPERLERAKGYGAFPIDVNAVHAPTYIQDMTGGRGADVVIECVGAIPALLQALDVVRPGGRVSIIGVYAEPDMEFPLNVTFIKGIDLKFCGTANINGKWDEAYEKIKSGAVTPSALITHRFPLKDALEGYQLFDTRKALKVVLDVASE